MKAINIKDFVLSFFHLRNAEEAAINAGIAPLGARLEGERLLEEKSVKSQLARLERSRKSLQCDIHAGLQRLAYGRINDAAALAFSEEVTPMMLAKADLFNVSEIKRIKGGGVEIKFFDRMKALEMLDALNVRASDNKQSASLIEALYGTADTEISSEKPLVSDANEAR